MMKNKFELIIDAIDFEMFQRAADYAKLLDVEILNVEDFIDENAVLKNRKKITLLGTPTDLFSIGRFFERLTKEGNEKAMRFKKTGKVKFPVQLVELCKLLEISPEGIAQAFINDLSLSANGSSGSDERMMAVDYFLRGGFGSSDFFEYEELELILDELDQLRRAWPGNQKEEEYADLFKDFLAAWYNKWDHIKKSRTK